MIRTITVAALAFAVTLPAISAHAAARDRVFVASYGSDSSPCTFGSPCKTFQNAVNVVAHGGEVTAIDSAGFGTFTINHSVTITSPNGVEAGIAAPAAGGAAITVNAAANDVVRLNGLTLDGANVANSNGILFNSGGTLEVRNSVIRNFGLEGVLFQPSAASQLLVSDTLLTGNGDNGLEVETGVSVTGALDHITAENNAQGGLAFLNESTSNISVSNSVIANSGAAACGITVQGENAGAIFTVTISDSILENNSSGLCPVSFSAITLRNSTISGSTFAIESFGGTTWVTRSTISGNATGIDTSNGGSVFSFGDNNLVNNATEGAFTTPTQTYK